MECQHIQVPPAHEFSPSTLAQTQGEGLHATGAEGLVQIDGVIVDVAGLKKSVVRGESEGH